MRKNQLRPALNVQPQQKQQAAFRLRNHIRMETAALFALVPTLALIIAHFVQ